MIYLQMIESIFEHVASLILAVAGIAGWLSVRTFNIEGRKAIRGTGAEGPPAPALVVQPYESGTDLQIGQHVILRYLAMAGLLTDYAPSDREKRRRDQDIALYGRTHVVVRNGRAIASPVKIVRFGVQVCNLSICLAEHCAKTIVRQRDDYALERGATHTAVATVLLQESEDILEAYATADFLSHTWPYGSREAAFWQEVAKVFLFHSHSMDKDVEGENRAA